MRCIDGASASTGTHTSCIAVRSDDRNDSNHRLTSGIRHSGFRVATPAAIVAVYDCRARSPSPSVDDSSSSTSSSCSSSSSSSFLPPLSLPPSLLSSSLSTFTFLPYVPPRTCGPASSSPSSVSSRHFSLPRDRVLPLSSCAIFRSYPSLSLALLPISLTPLVSPSRFLRLIRSYVPSPSRSLARSWSLPSSRSPALDPTRYRPHSRAQRRDRDICICIRVCTVRRRRRRSRSRSRSRHCSREAAAHSLDSAAPREVLKSHNCDIYIRATLTTRDRPPTGDTARILSGRANERTNERTCERTFAYLRGDYAIECYTRL